MQRINSVLSRRRGHVFDECQVAGEWCTIRYFILVFSSDCSLIYKIIVANTAFTWNLEVTFC